MVVGPSGSGKSSLVHAGLVPLLRHDGVRVATMVPGDRPMGCAAPGAAPGRRDRQRHRRSDRAGSTRQSPSAPGQLVLVVDQFEECWTLADDSRAREVLERRRWLPAATGFVASRPCVPISTTGRCSTRRSARWSPTERFALPPLTPQALEDAVVRPAERHGVDFEDGVVTAIVAEANAQPAGLPLLQFAHGRTVRAPRRQLITATELRRVRRSRWRDRPSRRGDLHAPSTTTCGPKHAQLFGRLVAPGQGAPDTRRRARSRGAVRI